MPVSQLRGYCGQDRRMGALKFKRLLRNYILGATGFLPVSEGANCQPGPASDPGDSAISQEWFPIAEHAVPTIAYQMETMPENQAPPPSAPHPRAKREHVDALNERVKVLEDLLAVENHCRVVEENINTNLLSGLGMMELRDVQGQCGELRGQLLWAKGVIKSQEEVIKALLDKNEKLVKERMKISKKYGKLKADKPDKITIKVRICQDFKF